MNKKNISVQLITLGCDKNTVDSEYLIKQLFINGVNVITDDNINKCDIVVINTCGFKNDAKEQSINTILKCVKAKQKKLVSKIYVVGCLSQLYAEELKKEIPEVDGFMGIDYIKSILSELKCNYYNNYSHERILTTPSHYAYLKIAEGCNRMCSFCVIPLIKGKYISKSMGAILKEAEVLADKGVKELILIAQETTYYGVDIYGERKLKILIEELTKINGIEWIRLHYTFPLAFPKDVLMLMKDSKKVCHYIDIPLQHINDRILTSMKRQVSKLRIINLIKKMRDIVPDVAIRTSFIVGYPGETEAEFEELCNFVREQKFERVGVFMYSHEEGSYAYNNLEDNIAEDIKQERLNRLMLIQQEISEKKNMEYVGKIIKIIIDEVNKDIIIGRTQYDSPEIDNSVIIKNTKKLNIRNGDFCNVKVVSANPYELYAELI